MAKDVQITQQLLTNLGYNPGPIDGSYGGKTKRALIQLYASQDKVFDGELSSNEIGALKTAVASAGISGSDLNFMSINLSLLERYEPATFFVVTKLLEYSVIFYDRSSPYLHTTSHLVQSVQLNHLTDLRSPHL